MSAGAIEIRDATAADLPRIFEIYNREVEHGISTFDLEPRKVGVDDGWLTDREPIHPVLVASAECSVVGWASLSAWSPRGAYRRTGEVSEYVHADHRGRGIGAALLQALVERARGSGVVVVMARIALPNTASIAIHEACGFRSIGTQRRAGEKLGRLIDVELMDLHLDAPIARRGRRR